MGDVAGGEGQALVLRFDGAAWSESKRGPAVPTGAFYPGIAVPGTADVWIVGELRASPEGTSLHFDGTAWTDVLGGSFSSVWVGGPAEIWVAGSRGISRRIAGGWSPRLGGGGRRRLPVDRPARALGRRRMVPRPPRPDASVEPPGERLG